MTQDSRESEGLPGMQAHRGQWDRKGSPERAVPQVRKVMRDSRENRGPAELRVHRGCKESPERPEKEKKASKAIPVRRVTRAIKVTRATWVNRAIPGHRGLQSAVLYPRPIP